MSQRSNDNDPLYMGGRGVLKKTDELVDASWATIFHGVIGYTIATVVPIFALVVALANWDLWVTVCSIIIALVSVFGGFEIARPRRDAMAALVAHRKAVEAETEKRGPGWARS